MYRLLGKQDVIDSLEEIRQQTKKPKLQDPDGDIVDDLEHPATWSSSRTLAFNLAPKLEEIADALILHDKHFGWKDQLMADLSTRLKAFSSEYVRNTRNRFSRQCIIGSAGTISGSVAQWHDPRDFVKSSIGAASTLLSGHHIQPEEQEMLMDYLNFYSKADRMLSCPLCFGDFAHNKSKPTTVETALQRWQFLFDNHDLQKGKPLLDDHSRRVQEFCDSFGKSCATLGISPRVMEWYLRRYSSRVSQPLKPSSPLYLWTICDWGALALHTHLTRRMLRRIQHRDADFKELATAAEVIERHVVRPIQAKWFKWIRWAEDWDERYIPADPTRVRWQLSEEASKREKADGPCLEDQWVDLYAFVQRDVDEDLIIYDAEKDEMLRRGPVPELRVEQPRNGVDDDDDDDGWQFHPWLDDDSANDPPAAAPTAPAAPIAVAAPVAVAAPIVAVAPIAAAGTSANLEKGGFAPP